MPRHSRRPTAPTHLVPSRGTAAGAAAAPVEEPGPRPDGASTPLADELHRLAVARRERRMGIRPQPVEPRSTAVSGGGVLLAFPVKGMTCRSCEVRIGRFVGRLPNVERVAASAVSGEVIVECSAPVPAADIEREINRAGYEVGRTPWVERDPVIWGTAGAGLVVLLGLVIAAQQVGLGDVAGAAGDLSTGGLTVALLLGLAAGVSTCMALVGGLVLGLSASFQAQRAPRAARGAAMRPALVFVGGRVAGYALFGAGLGAIGASIAMPPQLTALLLLAVAVAMALVGTRLTGLFPRLAGWSPTLPMGLGRRLGLGGEPSGSAYSDSRTGVLGALSFFLPCGFTQAVQVFALSTGSPAFGAALLGAFALGTAPGLLALAGLPIVVPTRAKPVLLRFVGVVVVGFALLNASAGLRLSGVSITLASSTPVAAVDPGILGADGVERLTTYQDAGGYSPSNVAIYAGYPVEWTVVSSNTSTCAASIFAPGVDIRSNLEKGPNTFSLPPLPTGVLRYTCAMGMYAAQITVVPKPSGPGASAAASLSAAVPAADRP